MRREKPELTTRTVRVDRDVFRQLRLMAAKRDESVARLASGILRQAVERPDCFLLDEGDPE